MRKFIILKNKSNKELKNVLENNEDSLLLYNIKYLNKKLLKY